MQVWSHFQKTYFSLHFILFIFFYLSSYLVCHWSIKAILFHSLLLAMRGQGIRSSESILPSDKQDASIERGDRKQSFVKLWGWNKNRQADIGCQYRHFVVSRLPFFLYCLSHLEWCQSCRVMMQWHTQGTVFFVEKTLWSLMLMHWKSFICLWEM